MSQTIRSISNQRARLLHPSVPELSADDPIYTRGFAIGVTRSTKSAVANISPSSKTVDREVDAGHGALDALAAPEPPWGPLQDAGPFGELKPDLADEVERFAFLTHKYQR